MTPSWSSARWPPTTSRRAGWRPRRWPRSSRKARIVILHHSVNKACIDRVDGFKAVVASYPEMTILDTQEGKGTTEGGRPVMRDLLGRFPDLDAVFPINDPSALGAISAIESAGKLGKVTVVTVDGSREAIAAIQAGKLLSSSAQFPQADRSGRGRDVLRTPGGQAGSQGHQDPRQADHQRQRRRVPQEPVSPCPTTVSAIGLCWPCGD